MKITLEEAEKVVAHTKWAEWDGWNLVFIDGRTDGFTKQSGIFRHGRWCVRSVSSMNHEGMYFIAPKFRKLVETTRN